MIGYQLSGKYLVNINTTYSGRPYTQPTGLLVVDGTLSPVMTLSNSASTSGIQNVIIGSSSGTTAAVSVLTSSMFTNAGSASLGLASGATGALTLTGTGAAWTQSGGMYIGGSASASGGIGSVTVNNTSSMIVGGVLKLWNQGALTLDNSGAVTANSFDRSVGAFNFNGGTFTVSGGTYTQSNGELTLNGSSATALPRLILAGATTSGIAGVNLGGIASRQGAVSVLAGAVLTNNGTASLGSASGGTGIALISGIGSTWNQSGGLYLGGSSVAAAGAGSMTVTSGGSLNVGGTLKLWTNGVLTLDGGSSVTVQSFERPVGTFVFNDGTLTVSGGTYTQASGALTLNGNIATALPNLVLAGATTSGITGVHLGSVASRQASLQVLAGALLTNTGTASFGSASGATGSALISGSGSTWTQSGGLFLGGSSVASAATGSMTVAAGGTLNVGGTLKLWTNGTLSLDSGGSVTAQSFDRSSGTFSFNGGTFTVSGGTYTQSSGALIVDGVNTPTLVLANSATASGVTNVVLGSTVNRSAALSLLNGAKLNAGGASSIASASGSIGTAAVSGTNSTWTVNSNLYVGGSSAGVGGAGKLTIDAGGAVFVGGTTTVYQGSQIDIAGGTFSTSNLMVPGQLTNNGLMNGNVTVAAGGTLAGTGTIAGSLTMANGSVYAPGNSPGLQTVSGNVTWNSLTYSMQVADVYGAPGVGYDSLDIQAAGALVGQLDVIAGATIDIDLDSYPANSPVANFSNVTPFDLVLVSTDGGVFGFNDATFNVHWDAFALANFLNGGAFSVVPSLDGLSLFVHFTPVPEPTTLWLGVLAVAGLNWRIRRGRQVQRVDAATEAS